METVHSNKREIVYLQVIQILFTEMEAVFAERSKCFKPRRLLLIIKKIFKLLREIPACII